MKLLILGLALAAGCAATIAAAEAQPPLQLRPKAAIATVAPTHNDAPFVVPVAAEPDLDLVPHRDLRHDQSRSSCSGERNLCYDPASGRIVYKPARNLMPEIPGLQRENISVKRDRVVFRYSF